MEKEEAIRRIRDHMKIHRLYEPQAVYINEAFELAIKALENMGCGCGICLAHNNM